MYIYIYIFIYIYIYIYIYTYIHIYGLMNPATVSDYRHTKKLLLSIN